MHSAPESALAGCDNEACTSDPRLDELETFDARHFCHAYEEVMQFEDPQLVAAALEVAKRAVYRGRGLSLQVPWCIPVSKLILVIDMFGPDP